VSKRHVRLGDVIQAVLSDGSMRYVQFGRTFWDAPVFRVLPGRHSDPVTDIAALAAQPDDFEVMSVTEALLRNPAYTSRGNFPVPAAVAQRDSVRGRGGLLTQCHQLCC